MTIGSCSALPEFRADERIQPATESVVGDSDRCPQAAQAWRGGIEQLPDRIEAPGQGGAQSRQRVEVVPQLAKQRASVIGEDGGQSGRRVQRVGDLEEVRRLQASTASGPVDPWADVVGAADTDGRPFLEQRERLVGLVERAGDDHGLAGGFERFGQPPGWAESGRSGKPLADERELEQDGRTLIHRTGDQSSTTEKRHGTSVHGDPA